MSPRAPKQNVRVDGDRVRLGQVFTNMLVNSKKYTPAGGAIDVSLTQSEGRAIVWVRDRGVGIPAEMLSQVFDLFTRWITIWDAHRAASGSGSRSPTSLWNGTAARIAAFSDGPDCGSEFVVELPLSRACAQQSACLKQINEPSYLIRVLPVDDDTLLAELTGDLIASFSAAVNVTLALELMSAIWLSPERRRRQPMFVYFQTGGCSTRRPGRAAMTPQAARLLQRSPADFFFPCPMRALRAFLADERSRRVAFFALLRPCGCDAIRPRLEIAVGRDRHGLKRIDMNNQFASHSLKTIAPGRSSPFRIFWTNWLRTAIASWTTNRIRALPSSDAASLAFAPAVEALSGLFLD
jgi:hypothetical protein